MNEIQLTSMNNERSEAGRIAITGIGLVTSVGFGTASTLAAIRGIIANFSEHETVMVNGDCYGTELSGAGIARMPEDIVPRHVTGVERAVALLTPAIRECTNGLSCDMPGSAEWRIRNWIEPECGDFEKNMNAVFRDSPVAIPCRTPLDDLFLGRCLFFEDIMQAAAHLRNGIHRMALVACVDSLCETTILERLCETGRLKSGTNPEGIVAGEAAGAVLLELESHARMREARIHAFLSDWGRGDEPDPWTGKIPSSASGLSTALLEAFTSLPGKGADIGMVVSDLNGEFARAYEWGIAAGRIFPKDDKERELRHPADCVGDCGAAMGAVLIATAVSLSSVGTEPLKIAVATSDEYGARRVLCIERCYEPDKDTVTSVEMRRSRAVLPAVVEQHCDDASSLWLVRNHLISAPHCVLDELARHDGRIEAHLDGLRLAGDTGWDLCKAALETNFPEDYFPPAVLAFESGIADRIQDVLDAIAEDPNKARALISALGWLPPAQAEPHINNLLSSESPFQRYLGIAASAIHRRDPGHLLGKTVDDGFPILRARSLRAYGELGRSRELNSCILRGAFADDDDEIRFSAAWSAILAGNKEAVEVLKSFVPKNSLHKEKALNTALRRMQAAAAFTWQRHLADSPDTLRLAIISAGTIGDPVLVPWLIEQMNTPALARVAGEAFTMITGVDLESEAMRGVRPEGFTSGPTDIPGDDNVAMDPDDDLPWPKADAVLHWWGRSKGAFPSGTRHLLGMPITAGNLLNILRSGRQRQRAAAALELAIQEPERPLFEVRAPGLRQMEVLRMKDEL